ncbi:MAG: hypothetical protein LBK72_04350, partial [Bifidobacteriaceae bacterium]|nr:hypothetical protein [Bifidobacteriaceae bacterium]
MTYLLDANVVIALSTRSHTFADRARGWFAGVTSFALCPITEGALLRFLVRLGEPTAVIQAILAGFRQRAGYEFWPDGVSYLDIDLNSVLGHRQVTDAYLAGLTKTHTGARLATMDEGLALAFPDVTFLLPTDS